MSAAASTTGLGQHGDEALTLAVRRAVARTRGAAARIRTLRVRPDPYMTSARLDAIDVTLDDGTVVALLAKHVDDDAVHSSARGVKPAFAASRTREAALYADVLTRAGSWCPPFHGRVTSTDGERLLLERVAGTPLTERGDRDAWRAATSALARLHAALAPAASSASSASASVDALPRFDPSWHARWLARAGRASCATSGQRRDLERLTSEHSRAAADLQRLPATIAHGECFPSNVIISGGDDPAAVFLDWETAGIGTGLVDLAAITMGWPREARSELALAYEEASPEAHRWSDRRAFFVAFEQARLLIAVQWLGWSPGWTPPPEHARDWLHDAVDAAGALARTRRDR